MQVCVDECSWRTLVFFFDIIDVPCTHEGYFHTCTEVLTVTFCVLCFVFKGCLSSSIFWADEGEHLRAVPAVFGLNGW